MGQKPNHAKHTTKIEAKIPPEMSKTILVVRLVAAALLFAVSLIVKMPNFVSVILLILSAAVAGYDIALKAFDCVLQADYFASPIVIVFVTFVSFIIGFPGEGAALVILYQAGQYLIAYAAAKTKKTALDFLRYQDEDIKARVSEQLENDAAAGEMKIADTLKNSASFALKFIMIFALIYAVVLPLISSYGFGVSIHRAITMLIVATPISVVAAMPSVGSVAMCYSAQQGVIFNDTPAMERAADVNVAVLDKAGVLTGKTPMVTDIQSDILDNATFMTFAAHAVYYSAQPFAKAILAVSEQNFKLDIISSFEDIPGFGVDVNINGAHVTLACRELFASRDIYLPQRPETDGTVFYMTVADRFVGSVTLSEELITGADTLAGELKSAGISRSLLLSEDDERSCQKLADDMGVDEAYGQCSIDRKLKLIGDLCSDTKNSVIFIYSNTIDGHSPAQIDMRVGKKAKYADASVLSDFVPNIPFSLQVCRRMREVAIENAVFAFVVKAILIFLSIVGYCNVWFSVFMEIAAILATILNSIRVTKPSLLESFKNKGNA